MRCWKGPHGIKVEVIRLNHRQVFKITKQANGTCYLIGYFGGISDLVRYVDLADLVEVIDLPER